MTEQYTREGLLELKAEHLEIIANNEATIKELESTLAHCEWLPYNYFVHSTYTVKDLKDRIAKLKDRHLRLYNKPLKGLYYTGTKVDTRKLIYIYCMNENKKLHMENPSEIDDKQTISSLKSKITTSLFCVRNINNELRKIELQSTSYQLAMTERLLCSML